MPKIKFTDLPTEVQQMLKDSGAVPSGGWHRKLTADMKRKYALKVLAICSDLTQRHRTAVLDLAARINNSLTKA